MRLQNLNLYSQGDLATLTILSHIVYAPAIAALGGIKFIRSPISSKMEFILGQTTDKVACKDFIKSESVVSKILLISTLIPSALASEILSAARLFSTSSVKSSTRTSGFSIKSII